MRSRYLLYLLVKIRVRGPSRRRRKGSWDEYGAILNIHPVHANVEPGFRPIPGNKRDLANATLPLQADHEFVGNRQEKEHGKTVAQSGSERFQRLNHPSIWQFCTQSERRRVKVSAPLSQGYTRTMRTLSSASGMKIATARRTDGGDPGLHSAECPDRSSNFLVRLD